MRQIEGAVVDGALLWVRGGSNRRDWDAEVFRTDLLKVWPKHAADASLPRLFGDATAPTEPHMLRKQLGVRGQRRFVRPQLKRTRI